MAKFARSVGPIHHEVVWANFSKDNMIAASLVRLSFTSLRDRLLDWR